MILKCVRSEGLHIYEEHLDEVWLFDGMKEIFYTGGIIPVFVDKDGDFKSLGNSIYAGRINHNRKILFKKNCDGKYPINASNHPDIGSIEGVGSRKECEFELGPSNLNLKIKCVLSKQPDDSYYDGLQLITSVHGEGDIIPALLNCYIVKGVERVSNAERKFLLIEGISGYIMNDDAQTIEVLR